MVELDINIDAKISPNDLDLEWREQAHLFSLYVEKQADAIHTQAKVESKLDNKFRNSWDPTWGKTSQAAIKAQIESDPEFMEADYQTHLWVGRVKAMEHKKQALENLVKLAAMNYFATPKEPKDLCRNSRNNRFKEKVDRKEVKEQIDKRLNKSRSRMSRP